MAHVADWKYKEIEDLTSLLTDYPVVGIAEIGGIPAPQMQQMRKNIRDHAVIRSSKNTLLFRSFDKAEEKIKGISSLRDVITGQTAIIATEMNPFKLYGMLKKTRTKAPAKGGEIAPEDIMVKAGDTPFKPGPIVGDLQKVGIPAAIQEGKVVIKTDKVVVPEGEKISTDIAQMLARLEIFPIEIGMDLQAVFEDGSIFSTDVLDIDIGEFLGRMNQASNNAFNLAVQAGWITKLTIKPLLNKAHLDALALAMEQGILTKETVNSMISKANAQMLALKNKTNQ